MRSYGIDARQINFHPGRFSCRPQRLDAVTRTPVRADGPLLLGFRENIHDASVSLGPITFGQAVHQTHVNVVGAQFAAEALQVNARPGRVACPGLGEDSNLVAGTVLERLSHMWLAAVSIG